MGKDKSSIQNKFLNKMIYIVFISIGLWSFVWIYDENATFNSEAKVIRSEYVESQKNMLKYQVTNVVNDIKNLREESQKEFRRTIMEQVNQAHQIASNIYQQNHDSKKLPEIEKMIKDALRPMRFNNGRGYYFAVSMDGIEQLYPVRPEFEGKNLIGLQDSKGSFVIQDEIKTIKQSGEGFVKSFWTKPDEDQTIKFPQITFVKFFKPLDWYIGTGDYLDDFEKELQKKILSRIANLRFGSEGYFFGSTYQGDSLFSNGKITVGSGNIWDLTDPDGIKIIQEQRKSAENSEGGFVYYSWNKLNTSVPSPKISFVRGIPDWGWTIGAGVYLDTIEETISKNKAALKNVLKKRVTRSIWILAGLLCLVYFWSKRISNQIEKSVETFLSFLKKAATESVTINLDNIQLMEFKEIAVSTNKMLKDRRKAEDTLKDSEEKYRRLVANISDVIIIMDNKGIINYKSSNITQYFGWSPDDLIGKHGLFTVHPDDQERIGKELARILIKDNAKTRVEYNYLCKDGSFKPVELTAVNLVNDPIINGVLANYKDITERKQMEADRERHLAAIEQVAEGIAITDTEGTIEYINSAFEKITGYQKQELIGKNLRILKSGEHDELFYRQLWEKIIAGNTWNGRLTNKKKNGSFYNEDATISPVFDKSGKIINFVAVKRDVTDEIRMEKVLQQSQKMESIGTLAGGIAHDFNNILFPIVGHTEMLLEDVSEDHPFRNSIREIYTGALRARDLVQQILAFSRQGNSELTLMKMQPIIKEALKLIRSTIPTTISIRQHLQSDCGPVKADPTQIHQIVMNLTTNAYHAMEDNGGELNLTLKEIKLSEYDLIPPDLKPGFYACLSITDTGMGMNKNLMDKIFEPYFTTKEKGKGTGMGLSVVHGIVKSMNGEIQVHSELGKGTEFHIFLPIAKSDFEKQETQTNEPILGGNESVLLVDDEKSIIAMERQALERLGYQITSCTSSIEALEAFRTNPEKFDLVITDMAMPNMPGNKLAIELIKIRPDIPILLCTGFSESMSEEKIKSIGIKGLLMKPIIIKDLAKKIREVLDK
jgi:PAS domain S-box-containing protein